jgi:hypothetical protein
VGRDGYSLSPCAACLDGSSLSVAGQLRRAEAARADGIVNESALVMRALKDFNLPKIIAPDLTVFQSLLSDLFADALTDSPPFDEFKEQCEVIALCGYRFIALLLYCLVALLLCC